MIAFLIWALCGTFIIGIGIKDMFSKKTVGFWANAKPIKANNVKGHNRATGLLFIFYGIIFILLGLPILAGQNSPILLLSILGVMFETIAIMIIYSLVITKKYADKD